MISVSLLTVPGLDLEALRNTIDGTGQFVADNGVRWVITGLTAHNAGDWEYQGEAIPCEFFGSAAQAA